MKNSFIILILTTMITDSSGGNSNKDKTSTGTLDTETFGPAIQ